MTLDQVPEESETQFPYFYSETTHSNHLPHGPIFSRAAWENYRRLNEMGCRKAPGMAWGRKGIPSQGTKVQLPTPFHPFLPPLPDKPLPP